jgi:transcriptional regulator GlxA family with amidase domain
MAVSVGSLSLQTAPGTAILAGMTVTRHTAPVRRVAVLGFPDAQILDITGPLAVFGDVARWARDRGRPLPVRYETLLLAPRAGAFRTTCGLQLVADGAYGRVRGIDTLLVAGGQGVAAIARDRRVLAWLRRLAPRVRRIGSVCTGTFVLAAAGLLEGRRATTHWDSAARLQRLFPSIRVEADPIFVRDGNVYTSAGVTAGMDLALALVEEDCGRDVAMAAARALVLFLRRPGGQSQFSSQLAAQAADREPLRELQAWIADHVDADCSVPALASRVAMSPRNFARVFAREVGVTPGRYVERARVEAARRRLEESDDGVEGLAAACGFGSGEGMRKAFLRTLRVPPSAYRSRFRAAS